MSGDAEKAELVQSLKAFLIPTSLFLATLISAAGSFLIYSGYSMGWIFLFFSVLILTCSFVAFVQFQNKLRFQGHFKQEKPELESIETECTKAPR